MLPLLNWYMEQDIPFIYMYSKNHSIPGVEDWVFYMQSAPKYIVYT